MNKIVKSIALMAYLPLSAKIASSDIIEGKTPSAFLSNIGSTLFYKTHDPRQDCNKMLIIGKNFEVTRDVWWLYSAMKKADNKHTLDSPLGKLVCTAMEAMRIKPVTQYKGQAIADEYNNGFHMYWFFSDADKFKDVKLYMQQNIIPNENNKPILLLEINNDPNLLTLQLEDWEFIHKYFTIPENTKELTNLSEFFAANRKNMYETNSRVESVKPVLSLGNDPRNHIFYRFQKACGEFKTEKIMLMGLETIVLGMIVMKTKDYLFDNIKDIAGKETAKSYKKIMKKLGRTIEEHSMPEARNLTDADIAALSKAFKEAIS